MNGSEDQIMFNPIRGARARLLISNGVEFSRAGCNPRLMVPSTACSTMLSCVYCGRMMYPSPAKQAQHVIAHLIADQCASQCRFCNASLTCTDSNWQMVAHLESTHFPDLIRELRLVQDDSLKRAVDRFFVSALAKKAGGGLHAPAGRAVSCRLCREIVFIAERLTVAKHLIAHLDPNEYVPETTVYHCRGCDDKPIGDRSVILDHMMLMPDHRDVPFDRLVTLDQARQLKTLIAQRVQDCFGANYTYGSLCLLRVAGQPISMDSPVGGPKLPQPEHSSVGMTYLDHGFRRKRQIRAPVASASCSNLPLFFNSSQSFVNVNRNQEKRARFAESSRFSYSNLPLNGGTTQTFVSMSEDDVEESASPETDSMSPTLIQKSTAQDGEFTSLLVEPAEAVSAEDIMGAACSRFSPSDSIALSTGGTNDVDSEVLIVPPAQNGVQIHSQKSPATAPVHSKEFQSKKIKVMAMLTIPRVNAARKKAHRKQILPSADDFYADDVDLEGSSAEGSKNKAEGEAMAVGNGPTIATAIVDFKVQRRPASSSDSRVDAEQLLAKVAPNKQPVVTEPDHQAETAPAQLAQKDECLWSVSPKKADPDVQEKLDEPNLTRTKQSPNLDDPDVQAGMDFQKTPKEQWPISPDIADRDAPARIQEHLSESLEAKANERAHSSILPDSQGDSEQRLSDVPEAGPPSAESLMVAVDEEAPDSPCSVVEFDNDFDPETLITCSNDADFLMS